MTRRRFDPAVVDALNCMPVFKALACLGLLWKGDDTFKPRKSLATVRGHVSLVEGHVVELLVNGPRWFDTRARLGGVGAISLAMHLYEVNFVVAVARLLRGTAEPWQAEQGQTPRLGRAAMS